VHNPNGRPSVLPHTWGASPHLRNQGGPSGTVFVRCYEISGPSRSPYLPFPHPMDSVLLLPSYVELETPWVWSCAGSRVRARSCDRTVRRFDQVGPSWTCNDSTKHPLLCLRYLFPGETAPRAFPLFPP